MKNLHLIICAVFLSSTVCFGNPFLTMKTHSPVKTPGDTSSKQNVDALTGNGNRLLNKGQFGAALPIWLKAAKEKPDNANINFKTGLCYRNSLERQVKALPYFKNAVKNMASSYNFNKVLKAFF